MEQPSNSKVFNNSSTQTDYISNKGKGLNPIDQTKHVELFDAYNDLPTPSYRENLNKVFNEEFLAEISQGPIPYKNNTKNNYIFVTVDRLSRLPHAETFHNCDTETTIEYLGNYCKLHGIPRSIRCDQAQAFKAKDFEIYCKNRNIKLILAPAGYH